MADYRFSRRAAIDLQAIAEFTIERVGVERARRYREELKTCFAELARGLRRFEHQSHVVFYQQSDDGVLIVRILHSRVDVVRRL